MIVSSPHVLACAPHSRQRKSWGQIDSGGNLFARKPDFCAVVVKCFAKCKHGGIPQAARWYAVTGLLPKVGFSGTWRGESRYEPRRQEPRMGRDRTRHGRCAATAGDGTGGLPGTAGCSDSS